MTDQEWAKAKVRDLLRRALWLGVLELKELARLVGK